MANPIYALCIGVSDYRAYAPSGRLDLPGADDDANRWARILRTQFALPDAQIRQQSGKGDEQDTDRAAIIEGLKWLGRSLAQDEDSSGLLTFSGHGLTLAGSGNEGLEEGATLALAPSDITPDLEAALTFVYMEEIIFEAMGRALFGEDWGPTTEQAATVEGRMENISAVLDACYSRPKVSEGVVRSLTGAGVVPRFPQPPPRIFARLTLACQLWEVAYEIKTAGNWHGAFTFAFTTMLEQWATGSDAHTAVTYSRGSYGDLVFRARSLINTLGLGDQNPALVGTANNLALVPFLRPGPGLEQGWTSVQPDGARKGEEISPGVNDALIILFQGWAGNNVEPSNTPKIYGPPQYVTFAVCVISNYAPSSTDPSRHYYGGKNRSCDFQVPTTDKIQEFWFFRSVLLATGSGDGGTAGTTGWHGLQATIIQVPDFAKVSDVPGATSALDLALSWTTSPYKPASYTTSGGVQWNNVGTSWPQSNITSPPTQGTSCSGKVWQYGDDNLNFAVQFSWSQNVPSQGWAYPTYTSAKLFINSSSTPSNAPFTLALSSDQPSTLIVFDNVTGLTSPSPSNWYYSLSSFT